MTSEWRFSLILNLIAFIAAGFVDAVYSGDGCDCPYKYDYKVTAPQLPKPSKYTPPNNYGYEVDQSPIQAKAKVSYTFDFSVEEPNSQPSMAPEKLSTIFAKVDHFGSHKAGCPYAYTQTPARTPCGCAVSKPPHHRYGNGQTTRPCKCQKPNCNCNLKYPNSINIETPVLVASGSLRDNNSNSIRRKRDLERIFFRPFRPEQLRPARYVKLYHKPISADKEKDNWFNMDFFSDSNPFKRKTKNALFPDFRSKLVKRDIKGEYDLLEKERQEKDLTIPEIIQYMPETLSSSFKRGPCQFGCREIHSQKSINVSDNIPKDISDNQEETNESNKSDQSETEAPSVTEPLPTPSTNTINDNNSDDQINAVAVVKNSFTKRNANGCHFQAGGLPIPCSYSPPSHHQNDYPAQSKHIPSPSLCQQQKLYAATRRQYASDLPIGHGTIAVNPQLGLQYSGSRSVSEPFYPEPLYYTGDLEVPLIDRNVYTNQESRLGSPNYPVQHISGEALDKIIANIVYRHPAFIEASSHYGGALVDPEREQAEQTKGFIKKLIDGRLGLFFDKPNHAYINHYPVPSFINQVYSPYLAPTSMSYLPAMY